ASVEGLLKLMSESLASFSALFRAVLLLHDGEPPVTKHEIVDQTVNKLNLDGRVFERIFEFREKNGSNNISDVEANALFGDYMDQIEKVIDSVDAVGRS
ncbi:MAG: hypothetical protein ACRD6X_09095, partial [Pyrinomonadaceae bacterium]